MALRRVLPDTNVCYPISLLDLMLRLDEASLHEIIWTEDLLVELEDTWVGHGIRTRADARRVCDDIRAAFVGQDVPRAEYEHLITAMPGSDPDDHVHAAAGYQGTDHDRHGERARFSDRADGCARCQSVSARRVLE